MALAIMMMAIVKWRPVSLVKHRGVDIGTCTVTGASMGGDGDPPGGVCAVTAAAAGANVGGAAGANVGSPSAGVPIAAATPAASALRSSQLIVFGDEGGEWSSAVEAREVEVRLSEGGDGEGCAVPGGVRMKLRPLVDYNWELKMHYGNPLAVHGDRSFYAYAVKGPRNAGSNGMIRVGHKSTDKRALIKGMQGVIHDLAFAHLADQIILASIDETGSFCVHSISLGDEGIRYELLLKVDGHDRPGTLHRVIWCPYVPEEEESEPDEVFSKLLVTTHNHKTHVWNISALVAKYGEGHQLKEPSSDCLTIAEHTQPIVDVSFSPDGTTLASASQDGYVMFFQICIHSDTPPKCIHKWKPHDGEPLSCLFFLDKHVNVIPDQFWKYAVTGSLNSSTLKVWCCKTWNCIQTFKFDSFMKPALDSTASYLILSDIFKKALYIMHFQDDSSKSNMYCNNITFFHVPYPVLCLGVTETSIKVAKCPISCDDLYHISKSCDSPESALEDDLNDDEEDTSYLPDNDNMVIENSCNIRTIIKLYMMQTKSLQEATISYVQPKAQYSSSLNAIPNSPESIKNEDFKNVKNLSENNQLNKPKMTEDDILLEQSQKLKNLLLRPQAQTSINKESLSPHTETTIFPGSGIISAPLNLMTPEAFSSTKRTEDSNIVCSPDMCLPYANLSSTDLPNIPSPPLLTSKSPGSSHGFTPTKNRQEIKLASGGSSPSREVQEIMSLKESDCFYEDEIIDDVTSQSSNHVDNLNSPVANDNNKDELFNMKSLEKLYIKKSSNWTYQQGKENEEPSFNASTNISTCDMQDLESQNNKQSIGNALSQVKELEYQLEKVIEYGAEQQKEMDVMKHEMSAIKKGLTSVVYNENKSTQEIFAEELLKRQMVEFKSIVDSALAHRLAEEKNNRENLLYQISQMIDSQIKTKISEAIAHETRTTIAQTMESVFENMKINLISEVSKKVSAIDVMLNDNLNKLFNSKAFLNKVSIAVITATSSSTKESFKQIIQSGLVPSMEKAQGQMLKQLNMSFNSGTKEYITAFENCTKKSIEKCQTVEDTYSKLNSLTMQMQKILEQQSKQQVINAQYQQILKKLGGLTKEIHSIIPSTVQGALEQQMSPLREVIREQISSGMAANAEALSDSFLSSIRSQTQTPAPVDTQTIRSQIDHHIAMGEVNSAFQKALSASDLKLLAYTMSNIDIRQVFSTPAQLQQNVLLSLIQQLGADMETNSTLKQKYLKKAVMSLDIANPVTKEHMPTILRSLQVQLSSFVESHPSNEANSNLLMLNLAIDGMLRRIQ